MKVKDLIERLQQRNPEADVLAFDPDVGCMVDVTGLSFTDSQVCIETDDMNE